MDFKTLIDTIKERNKSGLTSASSEEEIKRVADGDKDLDALSAEYDSLKAENARLKDTIIDGLKNRGTNDAPNDDLGDKQPKTIEDCIAEVVKNRK